ncbi:hypothetical protein [Runella sp.]|uniref:hypothetical protein n=1 Tax=Runella sp. TaxID=1960881 RepID=UPI003D0D2C7A
MRKIIHLPVLALLWLFSCQSNDSAEFSIEPALRAYNDEASWVKISYCSAVDCDKPYSEEHYVYNAAGKLVRVNYMNRLASGTLEQGAYVEYTYNGNGELTRKIRYGIYGTGWAPYDESEYEYAGGVLKEERTYFNRHNPEQKVLTGRIAYEFKDGKKIGQNYYDDFNKLYRRTTYEYKNNVLTRETWYGDKDNMLRIFEHTFAGNRRQIGEHMPDTRKQIALIEKAYDAKGRLITQETKVSDPLLCAMTPGMVRYSY